MLSDNKHIFIFGKFWNLKYKLVSVLNLKNILYRKYKRKDFKVKEYGTIIIIV